jgi:hypothetical protein
MNVKADRFDYERFQAEYGFRQEDIRAVVENTADQIPLPIGFNKLELRESAIHGTGCFTNADLAAGETIAPARIDGCRTPAGRFTNHSASPNCQYVMREGGDALLCAIDAICAGTELTVDYRRVGQILGIEPIAAQVEVTRLLRERQNA